MKFVYLEPLHDRLNVENVEICLWVKCVCFKKIILSFRCPRKWQVQFFYITLHCFKKSRLLIGLFFELFQGGVNNLELLLFYKSPGKNGLNISYGFLTISEGIEFN